MNEPSFWDIAARHPRIAAKAALVMRFYSRLHPAFGEGFFRGLARPDS